MNFAYLGVLFLRQSSIVFAKGDCVLLMISKCTKWSLYKSVVPFLPLRNILPLFQSLLSDTVLADQGKRSIYTQG